MDDLHLNDILDAFSTGWDDFYYFHIENNKNLGRNYNPFLPEDTESYENWEKGYKAAFKFYS